ncbi:uncharacterized protein [Henckelia pumila]|uniref:uncharacterized protein n=1 Tax=Henckelia pumila TaxID=405737 RepID=UPI003C6DCB27
MLTGDSSEEEFSYDPKIDRTFHRRQREARQKLEEDELQTEIPKEEMAANANLSLRQLGTPDLNQQPLCITFPTLEANVIFELKSGLIHLLPAFHGLAEEQIQLRAFPFSLKNSAKDWLYYLSSGSITTWTEMKRIFLEKYFPASRAANIRMEIYGIKQHMGESMIDAASGGVFVDNTPQEARNLIENMAANSQQFDTSRCDLAPRKNNERDLLSKLMQQEDFQDHHSEIMTLTRTRIIQETRASMQNFNTQVGQLATAINKLEAQNSSSFPSQTVVNPKENVSAITLRRGGELQIHEEAVQEPVEDEDDKESKEEENEKIQEAPRGDVQLDTAMIDLGASINVMSYSVYASLKLGPLNETAIVIQMADRSTICPRGVLEDVFVQVDKLVFPADFYVLDMKNNDLKSPILLGRPFLKTSKSVIDVNNGTLTMDFDGEIVKFHIFDTQKIPSYESDASKTEPKIPPDRLKGIPKKLKQRKHGTKLTGKFLKWVKVVRKTRYEPP